MFIIDQLIFEPRKQDLQDEHYYLVKAVCDNCGYPRTSYADLYSHIQVMIKKGRPRPIDRYTCPHCECRELRVYS